MSDTRLIYKLISTELDPALIVASTSIQPSKIVRTGDAKFPGFSPVVWDKNIWLLEIDATTESPYSFRDQLDELFRRLDQNWDVFVEHGRTFRCEVSCIVSVRTNGDGSLPSIHLTEQDIQRLNALHASFDIDLYVDN